MQNDLISRSALKKTFEDAELGEHSLIESLLAAGVYAVIDNAPTIDAMPVVHARWEWRETWGSGAFQDPPEIYDSGWACSACGVDLLRYLQSHFPDIPSYTECASEEMPTLERCPCCGAKMDGGAE